jgi:hypothetical protein
MKRVLSLLLILALSALLQASEGLTDVLGARRLLSSATWSEIVHVVRRGGGGEAAPTDFYALAFEFNRMLCLYCPFEGTRILSSEPGQSEEEKQSLSQLMRKQWPDLLFATKLGSPGQAMPAAVPANACFVQSVSAWQQLAARPGSAEHAVLLSYYWREAELLRGHTVLLLDWEKQTYAVDLTRADRQYRPIPRDLRGDPTAIARLLEPLVTIDHIHELPVKTAT